eukprot:TRINITY_DN1583_c0_g2_i2.p1 TRINITY_DN1583_c0_g2~~TRINITY_DN1583_c0_g2_i2.p1  ORF type:complete len:1070 (+),score=199.95 TRINITY_DN1583_c0_g2_i2:102-3311(+)
MHSPVDGFFDREAELAPPIFRASPVRRAIHSTSPKPRRLAPLHEPHKSNPLAADAPFSIPSIIPKRYHTVKKENCPPDSDEFDYSYDDHKNIYTNVVFPQKRSTCTQGEFENLIKWYSKMMTKSGDGQSSTLESIKEAKSICSMAFLEMIRQISIIDGDRSCFMMLLWRRYTQLFNKILLYFTREKKKQPNGSLGKLYDEDSSILRFTSEKIPLEFAMFKDSCNKSDEQFESLCNVINSFPGLTSTGIQVDDELVRDKRKLLEAIVASIAGENPFSEQSRDMTSRGTDMGGLYSSRPGMDDGLEIDPDALEKSKEFVTFSKLKTLAADLMELLEKRKEQRLQETSKAETQEASIPVSMTPLEDDPFLQVLDSNFKSFKARRSCDKYIQTDRVLDLRIFLSGPSGGVVKTPTLSSKRMSDLERENEELNKKVDDMMVAEALKDSQIEDLRTSVDRISQENKDLLEKIHAFASNKGDTENDSKSSGAHSSVSKLHDEMNRLQEQNSFFVAEIEALKEEKRMLELMRRTKLDSTQVTSPGTPHEIGTPGTRGTMRGDTGEQDSTTPRIGTGDPLKHLRRDVDSARSRSSAGRLRAMDVMDRSKPTQTFTPVLDEGIQNIMDESCAFKHIKEYLTANGGTHSKWASSPLLDPKFHALDTTWVDAKISWLTNLIIAHRALPGSVQSHTAMFQLIALCKMLRKHIEMYMSIPSEVYDSQNAYGQNSRNLQVNAKSASQAILTALELHRPSSERINYLENFFKENVESLSPYRFQETNEVWEVIPGTTDFRLAEARESPFLLSKTPARLDPGIMLKKMGESSSFIFKGNAQQLLNPTSIQADDSFKDSFMDFLNKLSEEDCEKSEEHDEFRAEEPSAVPRSHSRATETNKTPVKEQRRGTILQDVQVAPFGVPSFEESSTSEEELEYNDIFAASHKKLDREIRKMKSKPKGKLRKPPRMVVDLDQVMDDDVAMPWILTAGLASLGQMLKIKSYGATDPYPWSQWPKHSTEDISTALSRLSNLRLIPTKPTAHNEESADDTEVLHLRTGDQIIELPSVLHLDHLREKVYERIMTYIR